MVTAETAVMLPILVLVLAGGLWALAAAVTQLRCVDAASTAAAGLARGEGLVKVMEQARASVPTAARVAVSFTGPRMTVEVRTPVRLLPHGPGWTVTAHAVAIRDPAGRRAGRPADDNPRILPPVGPA